MPREYTGFLSEASQDLLPATEVIRDLDRGLAPAAPLDPVGPECPLLKAEHVRTKPRRGCVSTSGLLRRFALDTFPLMNGDCLIPGDPLERLAFSAWPMHFHVIGFLGSPKTEVHGQATA